LALPLQRLGQVFLQPEAPHQQYLAGEEGLVPATQDQKVAQERYNPGAGTLLDLLTATITMDYALGGSA
jgi:outer membrane protein TolC